MQNSTFNLWKQIFIERKKEDIFQLIAAALITAIISGVLIYKDVAKPLVVFGFTFTIICGIWLTLYYVYCLMQLNKNWRKKKYQLLPISTTKLFVANVGVYFSKFLVATTVYVSIAWTILTHTDTTTTIINGFDLSIDASVNNVFAVTQFLVGALLTFVTITLIVMVVFWISSYIAPRFQKVARLLLFISIYVLGNALFNGIIKYIQALFFGSKQFNWLHSGIVLGEAALIVIVAAVAIQLLKRNVETT
jgi:hypothetical protein